MTAVEDILILTTGICFVRTRGEWISDTNYRKYTLSIYMLLYALCSHNANLEVHVSIIYPYLTDKVTKVPMLSNLPKITQPSVSSPTPHLQIKGGRGRIQIHGFPIPEFKLSGSFKCHPLAIKEKGKGSITSLLENLLCTETWVTYFLIQEHHKPLSIKNSSILQFKKLILWEVKGFVWDFIANTQPSCDAIPDSNKKKYYC